jgi:hypothetical protein
VITNGRVLAAVIDCEGWVVLQNQSGRPEVGLKMCEPQYIAALNSAFPGGRVDVRPGNKPRHRPAYQIRYNGENARPLLALIAKYALIKGRQAEVALEALALKNRGERVHLIEEMHNLNRVGRIIAPEALAA